MLQFFRSSVARQYVAITVTLIILSAALIAGAMNYSLRQFVMNDAVSDSRSAARSFGVLFGASTADASVVVAQDELKSVTLDKIPALDDHSMVDRAAQSIAGVATLFEKQGGDYVRISTNVKKDDGARAVGTKLAADHPAQNVLARGDAYFGPATLFGKSFMTGYVPIKTSAGQNAGILFVGIPMEVYEARVSYLTWLSIIASAGATILFGILGYFAVRRGIGPLSTLSKTIETVSTGQTQVDVPYQNRSDELGQIARALEVFRSNVEAKTALEESARASEARAITDRQRNDDEKRAAEAEIDRAVTQLAEGLGRLVQGDLTCRIDATFSGRLETLRVDFNTSVERMAETLGGIRGTTGTINQSTRMMSEAVDELSKRTEQQAASLEETAAAIQEITETVRSTSSRVDETSTIVGQAKKNADSSSTVVQNAISAMSRIREASDKISQIIDVIDSIAFQTNLLALNAGVEAARAGEAGKGFAVVAQEVRELAQRSAKAAKEIGDLIGNSAEEVSTGSQFVEQTGNALMQISGQIVEIADHVQTIAGAAREQATALQEINASVNGMDQMTQRNAAMVEETNAATRQLADEADTLRDLVDRFRLNDSAAPRRVPARAA
ncbi:MAG: methyl-accepting chemotaxis protein [Rhizobium sp.]|nr:methyl-accepting chemotaxis protein [Rhizobium sp.]